MKNTNNCDSMEEDTNGNPKTSKLLNVCSLFYGLAAEINNLLSTVGYRLDFTLEIQVTTTCLILCETESVVEQRSLVHILPHYRIIQRAVPRAISSSSVRQIRLKTSLEKSLS